MYPMTVVLYFCVRITHTLGRLYTCQLRLIYVESILKTLIKLPFEVRFFEYGIGYTFMDSGVLPR